MHEFINSTEKLENALKVFENEKFIAVDTEFIRESTYFSKLCLIQLATEKNIVLIDPLENNINLKSLWKLFNEKKAIKVMHSGRQDMEIFYNINNKLPTPVYDTQIAAMVCGFGDQISYENLVKSLLNVNLDKSSRVSDWSFRPLKDEQITYALSDVKYLVEVYKLLKENITENNRSSWIQEEMNNFINIKNYQINPENVWEKIKIRSTKRTLLNKIKFLASWREKLARQKNIPKNYIIRDDTIVDIAISNPDEISKFKRVRGFSESKKIHIPEIINVLKKANKVPEDQWPIPKSKIKKVKFEANIALLKVLLKHVSENERVASRLIASQSELEQIAEGKINDLSSLNGWRYKIFGELAIDICSGKLGITSKDNKIKLFQIK